MARRLRQGRPPAPPERSGDAQRPGCPAPRPAGRGAGGDEV